jgi:hypothetical protein
VVSLCCLSLHDFDFFFGQAVEGINERVNLFIASVDLPPDSPEKYNVLFSRPFHFKARPLEILHLGPNWHRGQPSAP